MRFRGLSAILGSVGLGLGLGLGLESSPVLASPDERGGAAVSSGSKVMVPLTDMGKGNYLGFAGGLYPGGNAMPKAHAEEGKKRADSIKPLDVDGKPSASGKYVLLSIGMSNTTQEWGGGGRSRSSFMSQAKEDDAVNKSSLVICDGARGGQAADSWLPGSPEYDRIKNDVLGKQGLSEKQVVAAWLKQANKMPRVSLPAKDADAFLLIEEMGKIVRHMKTRYPNLKQVFVSSRIYAGYAQSKLNPEPYAYESGFAVKWLIEAQIKQKETGKQDERAGDLDYGTVAPWLAWGPYLWTDGKNKRSDGLVWEQGDCANDGTHPSESGVKKVGGLLLDFFKGSPHTKWFLDKWK